MTVGSVPPTPTIIAPADGTPSFPGQTSTTAARPPTPRTEPCRASALQWTVLLHHNTHVHTFVGGTGDQGSFVAENHGPIGTFSYEIILTATDSSGLKASTSVNLPVGSDTSPPTAPTGLDRDRGRVTSGRPELAGRDRQRRRQRLPRRALPGRGLHRLRRGRSPTATLQRQRPVALDHLPLSGAGGRPLRQPRRRTRPSPRPPPTPRRPRRRAWSARGRSARAPARRPPTRPATGTPGTINGANWTTQGRFGNALSSTARTAWCGSRARRR